MTTDEKLIERCIALEKIIEAIKPFYSEATTTENQKALLETMIGAALWYFPLGKKHWSNKVSKTAIEQIKQNPKSRLTRDHVYPRKASGKKLLTENLGINGEGFNLFCLYQNELASYVLVTPEENRRLISAQKEHKYGEWKEAYKRAKIELLDFNDLVESEAPSFIKNLLSKV